jgi:ATP-dependent DNA helicase RecG
MCFGYRPQNFTQTGYFWIDCVGYAGTDRADEVIQSSSARGRLDDQVDRTLDWFRSLGREERYQGVRRDDHTILPEAALREALVNAVCHRDYAIVGSKILVEVFDDRMVITNPGTLPNHVTPSVAMAGGHPKARNGLMVNFMQTMRYMEGRGRGWPRIRRAMKEHNGLVPRLEEERGGRWVRVTLPIRAGASA